MDKAELSKLLEQQVQDKLGEGYAITTYAMDAASRDQVKRELKPHGHAIPHERTSTDEWHDYLSRVEEGTYEPESRNQVIAPASTFIAKPRQLESSCSSTGLWKARRH